MAANSLTAARLRELLHYDPDTGVFTNRIKRSRKTVPGAVAGCLTVGRIAIRLDGVLHLAHRLAWLYMTGEWPKMEVDHRDGDASNNRWASLRDVPHQVNIQNQRRPRADNGTGFLGVSRRGDKFLAQIADKDGGRPRIGEFATPEEAHAAYLEAKRRLHAGCTI